MPQLASIRVYPIKSLDGVSVPEIEVVTNGGLSWDRRYAIVEGTSSASTAAESDGRYVNGKREPRIHELEATYDLARETVTVGEHDSDERHTFHLGLDRDGFTSWLSEFVGYPVELVRDDEGGFPDDTDASGPTVISTGTLEAVTSWYDGIDADEMCRRLRPNLILDAPAFWEDRLYEAPGRVVPFEIGSTTLQGVNPCQRCVVPTRNPDTGEPTEGFRETFVERREATLPEWAADAWFDHYFRLMVNTRVPDVTSGTTLATDDPVTVGESMTEPSSAD